MTTQVHVLDANTGKRLFAWKFPGAEGKSTGPEALTMSANGHFIVVSNRANGTTIIVLERTADGYRVRGAPIQVDVTLIAQIDATGDYLAIGYLNATVYRFDRVTARYTRIYSVEGYDAQRDEKYYFDAATVSFNDRISDSLLALGWLNAEATGWRVDLLNLVTGRIIWTHVGALSNDGQDVISFMAMHKNYLALSTWGSELAIDHAPMVYLWNDKSNEPLFTYQTPGSMFSCDIFVQRALLNSTGTGAPLVKDDVWVSVAGKHVHANIMGNGGDQFVFHEQYTS